MLNTIWFVFVGILGGALGGMGMGGGTLLIPLLSIFYNVNQHAAQAVNLVAFIPMAAVALMLHAKNGLVKFKGLSAIIAAAVLFGFVGSLLSKSIDKELLKKMFGGLLLALFALQILVEIIKKRKNKSKK